MLWQQCKSTALHFRGHCLTHTHCNLLEDKDQARKANDKDLARGRKEMCKKMFGKNTTSGREMRVNLRVIVE